MFQREPLRIDRIRRRMHILIAHHPHLRLERERRRKPVRRPAGVVGARVAAAGVGGREGAVGGDELADEGGEGGGDVVGDEGEGGDFAWAIGGRRRSLVG